MRGVCLRPLAPLAETLRVWTHEGLGGVGVAHPRARGDNRTAHSGRPQTQTADAKAGLFLVVQ